MFVSSMESANIEIEQIKSKIEIDFNANDADASLENIDKYLKEKNTYYFAKTYIVYINQFL
jgi:hypothetical protein